MQQPTKNDMEKPQMHETSSQEAHDGHNAMMWMMAICCGLPVLLVLVVPAALSGGRPSNPMWWAIAGVAVLAMCALMMRHHRGSKRS